MDVSHKWLVLEQCRFCRL